MPDTESWETQAVKKAYLEFLDDLKRKCEVERREVERGGEPDYVSQIRKAAETVVSVRQRLRDCQYADRQRVGRNDA